VLEFATWLQSTPLSVAISSAAWVVPTLQSLHILTIGVVFVSILMIALRVMGRARIEVSIVDVWQRFAPFLWWGIVIMVVTGVLLTISEPVRELMTMSFRVKMLLIAVGVVSAAVFGRGMRRLVRVAPAGTTREPAMPRRMRAAAVLTILLWVAIILLGRAIAYDDIIWGSWSPAVLGGADAT